MRGANWSEIRWHARTWDIPAGQMKAHQPHRVPMSERAMEILTDVWEITGPDGLLFPAGDAWKQKSDMTLNVMLSRLGIPASPHGAIAFEILAAILRANCCCCCSSPILRYKTSSSTDVKRIAAKNTAENHLRSQMKASKFPNAIAQPHHTGSVVPSLTGPRNQWKDIRGHQMLPWPIRKARGPGRPITGRTFSMLEYS